MKYARYPASGRIHCAMVDIPPYSTYYFTRSGQYCNSREFADIRLRRMDMGANLFKEELWPKKKPSRSKAS
jgi:hypothetical protein